MKNARHVGIVAVAPAAPREAKMDEAPWPIDRFKEPRPLSIDRPLTPTLSPADGGEGVKKGAAGDRFVSDRFVSDRFVSDRFVSDRFVSDRELRSVSDR